MIFGLKGRFCQPRSERGESRAEAWVTSTIECEPEGLVRAGNGSWTVLSGPGNWNR